MRARELVVLVSGVLLLLHGCLTDRSDEGYGSATVAALTSSDADYVVITVEDPPGTIIDEQTLEGDGTGNFPPALFSDLTIGESLGDELQHFDFAPAKRFDPTG